MICPACGETCEDTAQFCTRCGTRFSTSTGTWQPSPPPAGDDTTARLIPYRNPYALMAYYTGLFSFVCVFGLALAPCALITGILGLKHLKRSPEAHGVVHAWIGIILGGIFTIIHYGLLVMFIMAAAAGPK